MLQAIINFFRRLFGLDRSTPSLPEGQSVAAKAAARRDEDEEDDEDDEDASSEEDDPNKIAQEEWQECQQFIARCEARGIDLAGLSVDDPVGFYRRHFAIEQAQMDGRSKAQAVVDQGFHNEEHFEMVSSYLQAKWSKLLTNDEGILEVNLPIEIQNAMLQARSQDTKAQMAAAAAADPSLLAPVDGVTVEQWAGAAYALSQLGAGATAEQIAQTLAPFGLDKAKYDKANDGWQAKMQKDTSFVIAQKYGEAFTGAQNKVGGHEPNQEPCSFEKFVEVMAAQGCWSEQGLDVNAQLKQVFGIDAAEYSRYSAYWSPKMSTDMALVNRYNRLDEQYKRKYSGGDADADLSF